MSIDYIKLNLGGMPPRPRTIAESLDRYRTVAFGIEIMLDMIKAERVNASIEAGPWFHGVVPECYRPFVVEAIARAFEPYRGLMLTEETVYATVVDINREIWATVDPIMPGSIGTFDEERD